MSLEIILVPMAIALITKANSKATEKDTNLSSHQVAVETRMKNSTLLNNAMRNIGCTTSYSKSEISASLNSLNFTFTQNPDGIWKANFAASTTVQAAEQIISQIDTAYGIEVQAEVLRKIKERAPQTGMTLESETINEDSSVTVVLAVNQA